MHRRIGEDDTSTVEPEQYIPLHTCIFHMESTTQLWEPTSSASPFPPHIPSDWIRDWEKMTDPSWNRTGIFPCPLPHFTQNVPQNRQFRFSIPITYSIQNASENGRKWQFHRGTGSLSSGAHLHISHGMSRKTCKNPTVPLLHSHNIAGKAPLLVAYEHWCRHCTPQLHLIL
jgi:hypothetical protein